MIAVRKSNESDSQIKFTHNENTGILVQHKFKRAIFYVCGETVDTFEWGDKTPVSSFNEWVQSKRRLFSVDIPETNSSILTKQLTELIKNYK